MNFCFGKSQEKSLADAIRFLSADAIDKFRPPRYAARHGRRGHGFVY